MRTLRSTHKPTMTPPTWAKVDDHAVEPFSQTYQNQTANPGIVQIADARINSL